MKRMNLGNNCKSPFKSLLLCNFLALSFCLNAPAEVLIPGHYVQGFIAPATWDKGFLLVRDHSAEESGSTQPHLTVIRKDGTVLSKVRVEIPGATQIQVYDAAALDSSGNVVIAASGWSADSQHAGMLCFASPSGKIQKVVQTNPFLPMLVKTAPDGSIWAMGGDIRGLGKQSTEVFERFSASGQLLGKWMPASEFRTPKGYYPAMLTTERGQPALAASSDRIGAYVAISETWIEFAADGRVMERLSVASQPGEKVRRLCMTSSGGVFAMIEGPSGANLKELDRQQARWTSLPAEGRVSSALVGCENDDLILAAFPERGQQGYQWISAPSAVAKAEN